MSPTLDAIELAADRLLIEEELQQIVRGDQSANGPLVSGCVRYATFSGGKRLRPLLGLQVARAFHPEPTACLPYLAAVELLHTASLILDDLPCMDDVALRRSRPSAHVQFGEGIAVLAAFALVVSSIRSAQTETSAASRAEVHAFQSRFLDSIDRGGLISGQEIDLARSGPPQSAYSKTTPLFELACAAGLIGSDLAGDQRVSIIEFGLAYGRAFQSVDDKVDGVADAAAAGDVLNCTDCFRRLRARYRGFERVRGLVDWLAVADSQRSGGECRRISSHPS